MNRRGLKLICQNFITPMCMLFLNVLFIAKHALRNQNQSHQTPVCSNMHFVTFACFCDFTQGGRLCCRKFPPTNTFLSPLSTFCSLVT